MEITGKLHYLGEVVQKTDKFSFRELVLEVVDPKGQYTTYPCFQLSGNKLYIADNLIGQQIKVDFDIQGRGWTDPKDQKVKYFNTLVAWRVTPMQQQAYAPNYAQPMQQPYAMPPQVQNLAQGLGAQVQVQPMQPQGYQQPSNLPF